MVFGFFIFIACYNFLLFLTYRDLSFLWYVLYIFFITIFFLGFLGYAQQMPLLYDWTHFLQNNGMMIAGHFTQLFVILFTIRFLNLAKGRAIVRNLLLIPISISLMGVLFSFFNYNLGTKLVVLNAMVMTLILLGFGVKSCLERYRPAYYYIVGWGFLLVGSVLTGLGSVAIVKSEALTNWSQFWGALFETMIFSLALGDKMRFRSENAIQREKQAKIELADLNRNLEYRVRERTKDLQNLLNNIEQGIFVIANETGRIEPNYSQHLEHILNRKALTGEDPIDVLFEHSTLNRDIRSRVQASIMASLGVDVLTYQANEANVINEFHLQHADGRLRTISSEWKPIVDERGIVEKILVVVKDITDLRQLQIKQQKHNEELQIINEILRVPIAKWEGLVENLKGMIAENVAIIETTDEYYRPVIDQLFVNLHTAKGIARSFLLDNLTDTIFEVERTVKVIRDEHQTWDSSDLLTKHEAIIAAIASYDSVNRNKLGRVVSSEGIYIDKLRVAKYLDRIKSSIDKLAGIAGYHDALIALKRTEKFMRSLLFPGLKTVLDDVVKSASSIADELEKPHPIVDIDEANIGIVSDAQPVLVMIFNHLIRNSLDHGIEEANLRRSSGKKPNGRIFVKSELGQNGLTLTYGDDGAGLNINKIRELALSKGLITESTDIFEIANIIFLPGFSTSSRVTSISGNGVGMDAVRKYLSHIGASISLNFWQEQLEDNGRLPFSFTIQIPGSLACKL
ncbi:MAG: 7TM diverse intracellular signaling domain-containing protein [Oligoflexus sp.]